jgi:hypothetical protein
VAIFKDYISLKEAGRISGYHPDYIGALIRSNKVKGKKIGKTWMVSESDVRTHFSRKHYAPISRGFSSKKKLFLVLFIVVMVIVITVIGIFSSYGFSINPSDTGISAKASPQQSLTETVEPQSTDAEVMQASQ